MQRTCYWAPIALLSVFGNSFSAMASGKNELLEAVRTGHIAARGSVRSISCQFEIIDVPKTSFGDRKGAYWQDGDTIRCQEEWATDMRDTLLEPGGFKRVLRPKNAKGRDPSGEISAQNLRLNPEPWQLALFRFWAYPKAWTFEELLLPPHELRSVQRRGEWIMVHLSASVPGVKGGQEHRDFELTFDPKVNYLVRERAQRNGEYSVIATVSRFVEAQPGVFFPESVKTEHRYKSQVTRSSTVTFRNVSINEPLLGWR